MLDIKKQTQSDTNYYTKTYINGNYYTQTQLDTNNYLKSYISTNYNTIAQSDAKYFLKKINFQSLQEAA